MAVSGCGFGSGPGAARGSIYLASEAASNSSSRKRQSRRRQPARQHQQTPRRPPRPRPFTTALACNPVCTRTPSRSQPWCTLCNRCEISNKKRQHGGTLSLRQSNARLGTARGARALFRSLSVAGKLAALSFMNIARRHFRACKNIIETRRDSDSRLSTADAELLHALNQRPRMAGLVPSPSRACALADGRSRPPRRPRRRTARGRRAGARATTARRTRATPR